MHLNMLYILLGIINKLWNYLHNNHHYINMKEQLLYLLLPHIKYNIFMIYILCKGVHKLYKYLNYYRNILQYNYNLVHFFYLFHFIHKLNNLFTLYKFGMDANIFNKKFSKYHNIQIYNHIQEEFVL